MNDLIKKLNVESVRHDFPILHQKIHGHPLVYLDNAATTQKPSAVMAAIKNYYDNDNNLEYDIMIR